MNRRLIKQQNRLRWSLVHGTDSTYQLIGADGLIGGLRFTSLVNPTAEGWCDGQMLRFERPAGSSPDVEIIAAVRGSQVASIKMDLSGKATSEVFLPSGKRFFIHPNGTVHRSWVMLDEVNKEIVIVLVRLLPEGMAGDMFLEWNGGGAHDPLILALILWFVAASSDLRESVTATSGV
ncbi:MAG TPA: hypothetical protein VMB46_04845 [Methanomassiliicoccales archaeon]|nr:hypothetical protein [Methanomassiliicoccales archaeon]